MKFYQDLEITGAININDSITAPFVYSTSSFSVTASYLPGAVLNFPDPYTGSAAITNIVTLTSQQYAAIVTKDLNTLYLVV
jgi:hypothetical protein